MLTATDAMIVLPICALVSRWSTAGREPGIPHALYSERCLLPIKQRLKAGELKASRFLDLVALRYVLDDEIKQVDPEFLSLLNVNRPDDFARAADLARRAC